MARRRPNKKAKEFAYGATVAFGILLSISAVFNKTLMSIMPNILPLAQVVGSIYILYLAVHIWKSGSTNSMNPSDANGPGYLVGFLMQFINPKVVIFTLTVIPSFILPYYNTSMVLAAFVLSVTLIGFLAFITWIIFGTIFKSFLQKHQKTVNIIMTIFLVYSAVLASGLFKLH